MFAAFRKPSRGFKSTPARDSHANPLARTGLILRMQSVALMSMCCMASICTVPAFAQEYPNRPIRMIIPFPPGGATDRVARTIAAKLSTSLGQQVIADNRAGANSRIATEIASKANADGYTLLICALTHVTNPSLSKSLPYDTVEDFSSVALLARTPMVLTAHPKLGVKSFKELSAVSKAKPQGLNYASASAGTAAHLGMELFKQATQVNATHVSYKGAGPQLTALISGQVEFAFLGVSTAKPHVESGRLVAIATAAQNRSKQLPSVPTLVEIGYPGIEVYAWSGVLAPAKTPATIIRRLNQEINKALQSPEILKLFDTDGTEGTPGTPEAMSTYIESEIRKWAKVVREAGITAE
jgi:tripartite-type tricarboxylate transporter receptor subunit TctC